MLCGVSRTQLHLLSQLPSGGSAWQCTFHGGGSQRESRRARTREEGFLSIIKERERAGHRQDQVSRLSIALVFGTESLCKALLRYGPLCDTDWEASRAVFKL